MTRCDSGADSTVWMREDRVPRYLPPSCVGAIALEWFFIPGRFRSAGLPFHRMPWTSGSRHFSVMEARNTRKTDADYMDLALELAARGAGR